MISLRIGDARHAAETQFRRFAAIAPDVQHQRFLPQPQLVVHDVASPCGTWPAPRRRRARRRAVRLRDARPSACRRTARRRRPADGTPAPPFTRAVSSLKVPGARAVVVNDRGVLALVAQFKAIALAGSRTVTLNSLLEFAGGSSPRGSGTAAFPGRCSGPRSGRGTASGCASAAA